MAVSANGTKLFAQRYSSSLPCCQKGHIEEIMTFGAFSNQLQVIKQLLSVKDADKKQGDPAIL